ncbi:hypothetical protein NM688_g9304 [Phlebia brevispora]|uniref:Uncharacterized protein n=1 Tax=Phlebia brevispora TaxID=194682 RepID=A0ACC1RLC6_9APHY|nr:hypothetical protein NM688_g9304 [Phlebia brevispora]
MDLNFSIVNNGNLRVAAVREGKSAAGTHVVASHKNLPATSNQEWQIKTIRNFDLATRTYLVSLQSVTPGSFAICSTGRQDDRKTVVSGTALVEWYLEVITAPFGGAASFRPLTSIGTSPTGPYWTAPVADRRQITLQSNTGEEDQLWTFIQLMKTGQPYDAARDN